MRVMPDTNIFISMIFFPSVQTRELARRLTDSHQIVVCDYVVEELQLVTNRMFPAKRKFLDRFFLELPFELVYTPKTLDLDAFPKVRDTKDFPILATAVMEGILKIPFVLLDYPNQNVGSQSRQGFQPLRGILIFFLNPLHMCSEFTLIPLLNISLFPDQTPKYTLYPVLLEMPHIPFPLFS